MDLTTETINKILSLAPRQQLEIGGRKYTDGRIEPVFVPTPAPLTVHTLSGIVDYLNKETDPAEEGNKFIHVVSPTEVNVCGGFYCASFYERPHYLDAVFEPAPYKQGSYFNLEDFIIGLQAYFIQTETSAKILEILCNIKDESSVNFNDSGITQTVTAKTGISLVQTVPVPNPIKLKPFRTFPEIDQPESLFVFRLKQQEKQPPACGLWEADNKQWKVEAINNIAGWLQGKLPGITIIA
jgi:hypothetical protein